MWLFRGFIVAVREVVLGLKLVFCDSDRSQLEHLGHV